MQLRALILVQLVCIALVAAGVRGFGFAPDYLGWSEQVAAIAFYPTLVAFPAAALYVGRRAELHTWQRHALFALEVALVGVTLLAVLPAVQ